MKPILIQLETLEGGTFWVDCTKITTIAELEKSSEIVGSVIYLEKEVRFWSGTSMEDVVQRIEEKTK